jgi:hypothetical protein
MNREVEVMHVLRVPPMGKLVVEFQGKRYESVSDVTEENVSRLLLTAIGELITFAGGYENLVNEGLAPPIASQGSGTGPSSPESLNERQARFISNLETSKEATKVERKSPPTVVMPGIPRVKSEPSQALSPVEQIDQILQGYIEVDPELSGRSIHLTQHPAGGLQIEIDGRAYQRPSEIEDQRVQVLIKKAIKEWEAS